MAIPPAIRLIKDVITHSTVTQKMIMNGCDFIEKKCNKKFRRNYLTNVCRTVGKETKIIIKKRKNN